MSNDEGTEDATFDVCNAEVQNCTELSNNRTTASAASDSESALDSSDDETIDFENELSSAYEGISEVDDDKLQDLISPRRHLDEPVLFSEAAEKLKNADEDEASCFKVIGQTDVSLTCEPRNVTASWVVGSTHFPALIKSKADLSSLSSIPEISSELVDAFAKFSDVLFPVQQSVIPAIIASNKSGLPPRDYVISAPTGSGKTLCFVLPILNALCNVENDASSVYALVIVPVQNLAQQIYLEFMKYNIFGSKIVLLCGVNEYRVERSALFPEKTLSGVSCAHIIVATPGRLVEHLVDPCGFVNLSHLRFLVIDEADRMIDTARMEWLELVERRSNVSRTNNLTIADIMCSKFNRNFQKILCSATLSLDFNQLHMWNLRYPKLFKADANMSIELPQADITNEEEAEKKEKSSTDLILPANLTHQVVVCLPNMKPIFLYFLIASHKQWKKVLVFVNQTSVSRRLSLLLSFLAKSKFKVVEFSSNLYGSRRVKCLKKFTDGKVRVLIASDVLSRGIDVSNIDCVVNYNPPINERIFVHRAGRTARGLSAGTVVSLVDKDERMRLKKTLLQMNAWSDGFVSDRRDTKKFLNEELLAKYEQALEDLKNKCTSNNK